MHDLQVFQILFYIFLITPSKLELEISFDQTRFSMNFEGEEASDLFKLILFSGS